MAKLTISAAAKSARIGVETIRYYQRIGLVQKPVKPETGYRSYTNEDLKILKFIQRAKQLGFSLAEIKTMLSLGEASCNQTKQLASSKLDAVTSKIKDLTAIAATLEDLIESCGDNKVDSNCPIIDAMSEDE